MDIIIGGVYQGKLDYAKAQFSLTDSDVFFCSECPVLDLTKRCKMCIRDRFTDASSIAVYAKDAVAAMQTAGIINGISDGGSYRFAPEAQATRAQAASMIAGLYLSLIHI